MVAFLLGPALRYRLSQKGNIPKSTLRCLLQVGYLAAIDAMCSHVAARAAVAQTHITSTYTLAIEAMGSMPDNLMICILTASSIEGGYVVSMPKAAGRMPGTHCVCVCSVSCCDSFATVIGDVSKKAALTGVFDLVYCLHAPAGACCVPPAAAAGVPAIGKTVDKTHSAAGLLRQLVPQQPVPPCRAI